MMGFDPVNAFNLILERLDKIVAQLERIADEMARANEIQEDERDS